MTSTYRTPTNPCTDCGTDFRFKISGKCVVCTRKAGAKKAAVKNKALNDLKREALQKNTPEYYNARSYGQRVGDATYALKMLHVDYSQGEASV